MSSNFVSSNSVRTRRKAWYLLPIFFNIVGGIIAYLVMRNDDSVKAKRCLVIGASLFAVNMLFGIGLIPGLDSMDRLFLGDSIQASNAKLEFGDESLKIILNEQARFLAIHDEFIEIPLENLVSANALLPAVSDTDVRMPGTAIPGLIKAGTYLTENKNTEFWFTKDGNQTQIITIELQDHKFNRIVLQSEKNTQWIERIGEIISSNK